MYIEGFALVTVKADCKPPNLFPCQILAVQYLPDQVFVGGAHYDMERC